MGASVVDFEARLDLALMQVSEPLPEHVSPLKLTRFAPWNERFRAPAFPRGLPPYPGDGLTPRDLSGHVVNSRADLSGDPALQLHCEQAAAQSPLDLHGSSGAPVLVPAGNGELAAAGVVLWNPPSADRRDVAVGGIVFARSASAIFQRWPDLLDKASAHAPEGKSFCIFYCENDVRWAEWIDSTLHSSYGFSLMARYDYLEYGDSIPGRLKEAYTTHPNCLVLLSDNTDGCTCTVGR